MGGETGGPFKVEAQWDRGYIDVIHSDIRVLETLAYSLNSGSSPGGIIEGGMMRQAGGIMSKTRMRSLSIETGVSGDLCVVLSLFALQIRIHDPDREDCWMNMHR